MTGLILSSLLILAVALWALCVSASRSDTCCGAHRQGACDCVCCWCARRAAGQRELTLKQRVAIARHLTIHNGGKR